MSRQPVGSNKSRIERRSMTASQSMVTPHKVLTSPSWTAAPGRACVLRRFRLRGQRTGGGGWQHNCSFSTTQTNPGRERSTRQVDAGIRPRLGVTEMRVAKVPELVAEQRLERRDNEASASSPLDRVRSRPGTFVASPALVRSWRRYAEGVRGMSAHRSSHFVDRQVFGDAPGAAAPEPGVHPQTCSTLRCGTPARSICAAAPRRNA